MKPGVKFMDLFCLKNMRKNAVAVTDIYQFKGHTGSAFHGIFIPAGVSQISFFPASLPFFEASVIIVFILVWDNERDNVIVQAFFEHDQASNPSIPIIERV